MDARGEGRFPASATYLPAAAMFHLADGTAMYSPLLKGGSNAIIRAFMRRA